MNENVCKISCFSPSYKFTKTQAVKGGNACKITTVKNRHEGVQIVLSAKKDVSFFVSVSDFSDGKGNLLKKESVEIFVEYFSTVATTFHQNGFEPGEYPDALFPYEAAVKHGDNTVKAGENAVVYLDFYTPKTLPAGLYSGKITVETPQKAEIECLIEVLDITLTDEVTHKPYFNVSIGEVFSSFEGEEGKDPHGEVAEKYYEYVIKHRISPSSHFVKKGTENLTQAEQFAENVFYSAFEKNQPLMGLPCKPKAGVKKRFDETLLRDTLKAVTEKCLNEQKNVFPRLCFYNWVIDEPFCWVDDTGAVAWSIRTFNEIKKEVFEDYRKDERAKTNVGQEILSSLLDVGQVVTDYVERDDYAPYKDNFQEDGKTKYYYNPKEVTLCPKFDGLESAKKRKKYEGAKELWWYGCGNPASPWSSYHIDDCGFSPRLLAWMMQQYGIVGNLFWDMTFETEWLVGDDGKVYSQTVKDPYAVRRVGSNSDGTLMYPMKPYGVEEPIGGLRLKSIRDGYEDYELIALLKEEYQKRGKSADGIFARLTSPVYFDAKLDSFSETFDIVKEGFYRALELVCAFGITMQADFKNGETSILIEGADGVSSNLGKVEKTENGFVFTVKRSVDFATLSIRKGEEEKKFPVYIGEGLFVLMPNGWDGYIAVDGAYETVDGNNEYLYKKEVVFRENDYSFRLKFCDELLKGDEIGFVIKTANECVCRVQSGEKTLYEAACAKAVNEELGLARRIQLKTAEIEHREIQIVFDREPKLAIREFCVLK